MLPIVPLPQKQKRKNSKTNIASLNQPFLLSQSEIDKSKNSIFKINITLKNTCNNNTNKTNNKKVSKKNEKAETKNNNNNNNLSFIENAIINFEKGFYSQSLQQALKSIEIEDSEEKANYIAFLCYLEMYDID